MVVVAMALVVEGANNGSKFRGSVCKSRMPGAGYLRVRCPMGKHEEPYYGTVLFQV